MPASLRRRMPSWARGRVTAIALLAVFAGALGGGCGDAHWVSVRWPSNAAETPPQPTLEADALGLAVAATQIDYEPEAVRVVVRVRNTGPGTLRIERAAILLAWDELEYPPDEPGPSPSPSQGSSADPAWLSLGPGEEASLSLRYHLGRALTGSGAALVLRSLTRDGTAVVQRPSLSLPAKPS